MDFLQTYPQVAEYIEEFNYFGSLDVMGRLAYIHEHPALEMLLLGFVGYVGWELYKALHQPPQNPWTFGKRNWATMEDVRNACKTKTNPGMLVKRPTGDRILLAKMGDEWVQADIHATCVGTNGAGKGASLIVPNCLTWKGSLIVNDVKGENYALTHRYRREKMGQPVFVIDPYAEITDETNCFNPMDYIDPNDVAGVKEANLLAEILFPEKDGGNAFFDDGARGLIATTAMYVKVKYPPEQQNLATVRDILTLAPEEKMQIFLDMQKCTEFDGAIRKGINQLLELGGTPTEPKQAENEGDKQKQKQGKEQQKSDATNETLLDLYATANIALKIFDDKRICNVLSKSDMSLHMLKYIPQTIYLVISASDLKVSGMLMRLIYTYALSKNATSKRPVEAAAQNLEPNENPTLFLLDEFAQLKKFLPVKDMMPLARGYKIRFLIILQGQKQLDEYYKDGGNDFIVNATRIYLGAEDNETAEEISKFCGETTVRSDSQDLKTKNKNVTWQGARLISVGKVLEASPLEPFIFKGNVPPIRARQARYFEDPFFAGKTGKYTPG